MKLEHIAFNVADPIAVAAWYGKHCGLRIVRHIPKPYQTHFLADDGSTIIEIYCNPMAEVPNYWTMDPLVFHLALTSANAVADTERLVDAGATIMDESYFPDGSNLVMLRDPWGLALQLCHRAKPLL